MLYTLCAGFPRELSTLSEGNFEIVDEMSVVAGDETTVEISAAAHGGDIMIKPEELGANLVAIVHLDDGRTQVLLLSTTRPTL